MVASVGTISLRLVGLDSGVWTRDKIVRRLFTLPRLHKALVVNFAAFAQSFVFSGPNCLAAIIGTNKDQSEFWLAAGLTAAHVNRGKRGACQGERYPSQAALMIDLRWHGCEVFAQSSGPQSLLEFNVVCRSGSFDTRRVAVEIGDPQVQPDCRFARVREVALCRLIRLLRQMVAKDGPWPWPWQ